MIPKRKVLFDQSLSKQKDILLWDLFQVDNREYTFLGTRIYLLNPLPKTMAKKFTTAIQTLSGWLMPNLGWATTTLFSYTLSFYWSPFLLRSCKNSFTLCSILVVTVSRSLKFGFFKTSHSKMEWGWVEAL